jgi:hypothetical protein
MCNRIKYPVVFHGNHIHTYYIRNRRHHSLTQSVIFAYSKDPALNSTTLLKLI